MIFQLLINHYIHLNAFFPLVPGGPATNVTLRTTLVSGDDGLFTDLLSLLEAEG